MSRSAAAALAPDPDPAALAPPLADPDQRGRLLLATYAVVAERGYEAAGVADIAAAAGASPSDFARHFESKEAAFAAAYEIVVGWLDAEVRGAMRRHGGWPHGVGTAVAATLERLAAEPGLARFCGGEPLLAGPAALARHRATVASLAQLLRGARAHCAWAEELPSELEETLVGGAIFTIAAAARTDDAGSLAALAPELTYYLLTPYLDAPEARRIADGGGR